MKKSLIKKTRYFAFSLVAAFVLTSCAEKEPLEGGEAAAAAPAAVSAEKEPGANVVWIKERFGGELIKADGTKVSTDTLAGKRVGIYFSAHWCPPCRAFSPVLVEAYSEIKKKGLDFEIVFASSDQNEKAMINYMKELKMPWAAIPYDSPLRTQLGTKYGVQGIPTLVILDAAGNTVTKDGRDDVIKKKADAIDGW